MRKKKSAKKPAAKKQTAKKTVAKRGRATKATTQRKPKSAAKPARKTTRAKRVVPPVVVALTEEQVKALARAVVDELEARTAANEGAGTMSELHEAASRNGRPKHEVAV